jgi:DHA2 family multidrug resistance protein
MIAPRVNPLLVAVIVSLAAFMEVLDTTITNVSLRHIAGSLGAGQDESTWVLTSYLVANGIILPLSGWLSDAVGRKRYFIACIIGFTVASFFCGAATSLNMLVIYRVIQGAAGGGLQPTQQAIIVNLFPPEKRGLVFTITGITMIVAPVIGPTLGGIITDHLSWRWIFYINLPVGIIAGLLVWLLLDEPENVKPTGFANIDYIGVSLIALGLAAMQIVLDKGQQYDWWGSPFIVVLSLLYFIALVIAIIWIASQKDQILDLTLFQDLGFSCACILIFVTGFTLYSGAVLLPLMLQTLFGYTATLAGLIISPGGLSIIFMMPIAGYLIGKVEYRYLIFVGLMLTCLGNFYLTTLNSETDFNTFVMMRVLQVLGLPFLFIGISGLAFANIPEFKSNKASALYAMFRNIGGSVGIAVSTTYLTRHQQIHQNYLSAHLVPGSLPYEQYLRAVQSHVGNASSAMNYVYANLQAQASILAYIDTYSFVAMIVGFVAVIALFVVPSNSPGAKMAMAGH